MPSQFPNKKVCLLLAGGTALAENDSTPIQTEADVAPWLKKLTELAIIGEITPVFICGEENRLLGQVLWQKLSQTIFERLNDFDGFVVTSISPDLLYNALALSFALQNLNKPVVFIGSPLLAVHKNLIEAKKVSLNGLGLRASLINAIQIATMPFGAVGLVFGKFCLRAVKTPHIDLYSLNIFGAPDESYLAKIDFSFSLFEPLALPSGTTTLKNNFAAKVLSVDYYPGLDFEAFKKSIQGAAGVMLKGLSFAPLDESFLEKLKKLSIPVLVYNRFYVPPLNGDNLIECYNLTKQTALIKFIWALGQTSDLAEIRGLMAKEFCGEFLKT
ncbi:MAG: asparaginase domain-containing protein [Patescibacteria group bacterium]|jgi:L-asparaginase